MYGYTKECKKSFEEAVQSIKEKLKEKGFGVLCEINIKEKLKEKLGVDFKKYVILGACNPKYAFEALKKEKELGLLLPCNVIVYEDEGKVFVSSIMATKALSIAENNELNNEAEEVEKLLKEAVDNCVECVE